MTVRGFWGLEVIPGRKYHQTVTASFRLSMAALTEEIKSNKPTTVYVSVNEKQFALCTLVPDKVEQQLLDLILSEGEEIMFTSNGANVVHLTGNYEFDEAELYRRKPEVDKTLKMLERLRKEGLIEEDVEMGSEDEEIKSDEADMAESDEDEEESDEEEEESEEDEDEEEEEESEEEEEEEKPAPTKKDKKRVAEPIKEQPASKKQKAETQSKAKAEQEKKKQAGVKAKAEQQKKKEAEAKAKAEQEKKKQAEAKAKADQEKKKQAEAKAKADQEKKKKQEEAKAKAEQEKKQAEAKAKEKKEEKSVKKLPNGLIIEELKKGQGAAVAKNDRIYVRYTGRLQKNNKVFDSNTGGKPFSFIVGRQEVISGWDLGVVGMQINGERRLTIPPKLAYGSRGVPPDIPGNSTLIFDIKLVKIKSKN
ncbi:hypothetical protein VTP01DRAFT_3038 [Rhizomucor pusillus]|uniref:uncharacterized protein n=1 Tax=Rhizomucor pusillus TaxID=4840 RepID=UPI003741F14A